MKWLYYLLSSLILMGCCNRCYGPAAVEWGKSQSEQKLEMLEMRRAELEIDRLLRGQLDNENNEGGGEERWRKELE